MQSEYLAKKNDLQDKIHAFQTLSVEHIDKIDQLKEGSYIFTSKQAGLEREWRVHKQGPKISVDGVMSFEYMINANKSVTLMNIVEAGPDGPNKRTGAILFPLVEKAGVSSNAGVDPAKSETTPGMRGDTLLKAFNIQSGLPPANYLDYPSAFGGRDEAAFFKTLATRKDYINQVSEVYGINPDAVRGALAYEYLGNWWGQASDVTLKIGISDGKGIGWASMHDSFMQKLRPGLSGAEYKNMRLDLDTAIPLIVETMALGARYYKEKSNGSIDISGDAYMLAYVFNTGGPLADEPTKFNEGVKNHVKNLESRDPKPVVFKLSDPSHTMPRWMELNVDRLAMHFWYNKELTPEEQEQYSLLSPKPRSSDSPTFRQGEPNSTLRDPFIRETGNEKQVPHSIRWTPQSQQELHNERQSEGLERER